MRNALALKNRYLRHIHWAVFSPSLMSEPAAARYVRDLEHQHALLALLHKLDDDPEEIETHFGSLRHMPMGKYFEQLLFFILERDERYEIILQNHQICEEKTTIGEIDLIVKDAHSGQLEHWEMALKFYLQSEPTSEHKKMIGPNAVDDLARKMQKLTEHQLLLSHHPSIKILLETKEPTPKLFLKGQFFYHLGKTTVLPLNADPEHEHGWWCRISEMDDMITNDLQWYILKKPDWIGLHRTENTTLLFNSNEIKDHLTDHFNQKNSAVLIVGMTKTETGWMEHSRGFIVSGNWPRLTRMN